jgi:hypothetical protein
LRGTSVKAILSQRKWTGVDFVPPQIGEGGRPFHNVKQSTGNFLCLKSENGVDSRAIVAQINKAGSGGQLLGR